MFGILNKRNVPAISSFIRFPCLKGLCKYMSSRKHSKLKSLEFHRANAKFHLQLQTPIFEDDLDGVEEVLANEPS